MSTCASILNGSLLELLALFFECVGFPLNPVFLNHGAHAMLVDGSWTQLSEPEGDPKG